MDLKLRDRVAIISGASGGIGRATCMALAREGAQTIVVARSADKLASLVDEVTGEGWVRPLVIVDDLLDEDSYDRVTQQALEAFPAVDIVVNNLGQARPFDLDTTEDEWEEAFRLNFMTARRLTRPFLDGMRERRFGRVICLTATSEPSHVSGSLTSKAALLIWAKGLARVVAADGITVNCISPGYLMTEQTRNNFFPRFAPTPEEQTAFLDREIPMRHFGEPEDAASIITFMCSPVAGYITGQRIYVDGGWNRHV